MKPYVQILTGIDSQATLTRIISPETVVLHQAQPINGGATAIDPGALPVARTGHLVVYADKIVLRGSFFLPGQMIQLVGRVIEFQADHTGVMPALVVDGRPGKSASSGAKPQAGKGGDGKPGWSDVWEPLPDQASQNVPGGPGDPGGPGAPGDNGDNGTAAGSITLIADVCKAVAEVRISARGGAGGDGQPGGDGGIGGTGGPGNIYGMRWFLPPVFNHGTRGGDAGEGGPGGSGGKGGQGSNGGHIRIGVGNWDGPALRLDGSASRGDMGKAGAGGKGGDPGAPGIGGLSHLWHSSSYSRMGGYYFDQREPDGNLKRRGLDMPTTVNDPATGKDGDTAYVVGVTRNALGSYFSRAWVASLLSLAEDLYLEYSLSGEAQTLIRAHGLYQWLIDCLSFFDQPQKEATLDDSQIAEKLHLSDLVRAIDSQAWAYFAEIYMRATARMYDIGAGMDIFGMGRGDVPRLNRTFYTQALAAANSVLKDVGTALEAYERDDAKSEQDTALARSALQSYGVAATAISTLIDTEQKALAEIVASVHEANAEVENRRRAVIAHEAEFKKSVQSLFKKLMELSGLLDVAETLSFTPHDSSWQQATMFASQGGTLLKMAANQISGVNDQSNETNLMLGRVQVLTDDIKDLSDAYSLTGGKVVVRDPGATMLLARESSLKSLLAPFHESTAGRALEDAVHEFIASVQTRNGLLLDYNQRVARYVALKAEQAQTKSHIDGAATMLAQSAAQGFESAYVASALRTAFQSLKRSVSHALVMQMRAYRYWALDAGTAFGTGISGLLASYKLSAAAFAKSIVDQNNAVANTLEARAAEAQKVPSDDKDVGVVIVFSAKSHPAIIESLRSRGEAIVELVPDARLDQSAGQELCGLSEIRVRKMRPWLRGAKSASNLLSVTITHLGEETIVDTNGKSFQFKHAPVRRLFKFDPRTIEAFKFTDKERQDGSFFASADRSTMPKEATGVAFTDTGLYSNEDTPYSDVGLYAKWSIRVIGADPDALREVDALALEFWASFYTSTKTQRLVKL